MHERNQLNARKLCRSFWALNFHVARGSRHFACGIFFGIVAITSLLAHPALAREVLAPDEVRVTSPNGNKVSLDECVALFNRDPHFFPNDEMLLFLQPGAASVLVCGREKSGARVSIVDGEHTRTPDNSREASTYYYWASEIEASALENGKISFRVQNAGEGIESSSIGLKLVKVEQGDTLWGLSRATYKFGRYYPYAFQASGAVVEDPNKIFVGDWLLVPYVRNQDFIGPRRIQINRGDPSPPQCSPPKLNPTVRKDNEITVTGCAEPQSTVVLIINDSLLTTDKMPRAEKAADDGSFAFLISEEDFGALGDASINSIQAAASPKPLKDITPGDLTRSSNENTICTSECCSEFGVKGSMRSLERPLTGAEDSQISISTFELSRSQGSCRLDIRGEAKVEPIGGLTAHFCNGVSKAIAIGGVEGSVNWGLSVPLSELTEAQDSKVLEMMGESCPRICTDRGYCKTVHMRDVEAEHKYDVLRNILRDSMIEFVGSSGSDATYNPIFGTDADPIAFNYEGVADISFRVIPPKQDADKRWEGLANGWMLLDRNGDRKDFKGIDLNYGLILRLQDKRSTKVVSFRNEESSIPSQMTPIAPIQSEWAQTFEATRQDPTIASGSFLIPIEPSIEYFIQNPDEPTPRKIGSVRLDNEQRRYAALAKFPAAPVPDDPGQDVRSIQELIWAHLKKWFLLELFVLISLIVVVVHSLRTRSDRSDSDRSDYEDERANSNRSGVLDPKVKEALGLLRAQVFPHYCNHANLDSIETRMTVNFGFGDDSSEQKKHDLVEHYMTRNPSMLPMFIRTLIRVQSASDANSAQDLCMLLAPIVNKLGYDATPDNLLLTLDSIIDGT
jgi:hypothetical protein